VKRRRYLWLLDPEIFFGVIDPAYAGEALSGVGSFTASRRHKLKAILKVYRLDEAYPHTPDHNTAFSSVVRTDTSEFENTAFSSVVRTDTSEFENTAFSNAVRTDTPTFHSVT